MKNSLMVVQIILAVLVSFLIFMQSKGSGLSKSIVSKTYHTNRGLEIVMFRLTIIIVVIFVLASVYAISTS